MGHQAEDTCVNYLRNVLDDNLVMSGSGGSEGSFNMCILRFV